MANDWDQIKTALSSFGAVLHIFRYICDELTYYCNTIKKDGQAYAERFCLL